MRPLAVIFHQPAISNLPCLIQRSEQIKIQALCPVRPVKTFDKGILRWLAGPDKFQYHTMCANVSETSSGTLSIRIFSGYPQFATILSSIVTSRCAGVFRSISIASASRLKSSTTLKVRKRRQHVRASCIKLIYQLWFSASGVRQRSRIAHRQALFTLTPKIQFQQAVNPVYALVVPDVALPAQHLKKFLKSVAGITFSRLCQPLNHRFITSRVRLIMKHSPAQR
ncbi:hypothetical protein NB703_000363 [Pantoea ananatis]|uniref:Uncharacterized protein n=1 Tax=Pantoea ananas TaxID=553 RepID=A0AAJ1FSC6_PANAN|nr:hypothetical protein [Pantoea ananatis]